MLRMSRARVDLSGVRQNEQLQQLGEATEREIDHLMEALPELADQFRKLPKIRARRIGYCMRGPKVQ